MSRPKRVHHKRQVPPLPPPHCHPEQEAPDPVYMEIEYLAYQIHQSGATKPLLQKISAALQAYETIVRMEKRLVHARLEATLAQIDAQHQQVFLKPEVANQSSGLAPETHDKNEQVNLDETYEKKQDDKVREETKCTDFNEKQKLIKKYVDAINNLPVLEDRKFIIPYSARLTTLVQALNELDDKLQNDSVIANDVFMKVVDLLELEWIEYVKKKDVIYLYVNLCDMVDFLQQEALKEANKMNLSD